MRVELKAKAGDNEVIIPAWLWAGTGTVLLLLVGGLGSWFGGTVFDHEHRITVNEGKINSIDKTTARIETTVEKIDDKIDKLIDYQLKRKDSQQP